MTNEEAIEILMANKLADFLATKHDGDEVPTQYTQAADLAIDALRKQIPEKTLGRSMSDIPDRPNWTDECPDCGNKLNDNHSFCPVCGQAIDWSEVK